MLGQLAKELVLPSVCYERHRESRDPGTARYLVCKRALDVVRWLYKAR